MNIISWLHFKKMIQQRFIQSYDKFIEMIKSHPLLGGGIGAIILIIILSIGFFLLNLAPVDFSSREHHLVTVPFGASTREISQILEKQGIVRNRIAYELYVRLNPRQRMAKSGRYLLSPGMSVPRVVAELTQGTANDIQITIPEGLTNREIANLLAAKGIVNRDVFLKQLEDRSFISEILGDIPLNDTVEGYLYPDTYRFSVSADEKEIISTMLHRFRQIYETHLKQIPKERIQEVLIIASIVEEEARKADERPIIAGVFYNRLKQGYRLQSCATVQYALGKHKEHLLYQDLQISSPYNTYRHSGLPPGPITNPGLSSLLAAAHPAQVSYLYFVAKADGSHIFSNTYQEHLRAQGVKGIGEAK